MKLRSFAACGLAATTLHLAFGAPLDASKVTRFRSTSELTTSFYCTATGCTSFFAQVFDDFPGGTMLGKVGVYWSMPDGTALAAIQCEGFEYAKIASVKINGTATVTAAVDPAGPGCGAYLGAPLYSGAPFSINLAGQPNDSYHISQTIVQTERRVGTTTRFTQQVELFGTIFYGTIGVDSGPFEGTAEIVRNSNRVVVK